jgi:ankyrin repeat protein
MSLPSEQSFSDSVAEFIKAACVPLDASHSSGTLERAETVLEANPQIATHDIFVAAILGDVATVRRFLSLNPENATAKGGPHGWDALTHLCFSRYLRLAPERSQSFVSAARALLDAGASANTGFMEPAHQPAPEWEPALYGAAGIAHHAELTRLLLERGADPNQGEVAYHAPETDDNSALKALVESGKLTADTLATMLLRKSDWHDYEGIKYLLEHGADPNRMTHWGYTALHQALRRDNQLQIIELLLRHGANPNIKNQSDGKSVVSIAARRGRGDALTVFQRSGIDINLNGVEKLIAASAKNDFKSIQTIRERETSLVGVLISEGGTLLAQFAGNGNSDGVRHLLNLGVNVAALYTQGDGYFGIAPNSTALHVAAWRAQHTTVNLLIEHGAPLDALDGNGRTALALAVRACVDSYWTHQRSPESVELLLRAGASLSGVDFSSGYQEVDDLLRAHRNV